MIMIIYSEQIGLWLTDPQESEVVIDADKIIVPEKYKFNNS
jgi:hypothetical protein